MKPPDVYFEWTEEESREMEAGFGILFSIGAIALLEYFLDMPFWQILLIVIGIAIYFHVYMIFTKATIFGKIGVTIMVIAVPIYILNFTFRLKKFLLLLLIISLSSYIAWFISKIIKKVKDKEKIKIFQTKYPELNIKKSDFKNGIIFNEEKEVLYYFDKKKTVIEEIPFSKIDSFAIKRLTCVFNKESQQYIFSFPLFFLLDVEKIFNYISARNAGEIDSNTFKEYTVKNS